MFSRRCAKYPDFTSLNRVLDGLYGASVSAGILKRGEAQILSFSMTAIDDRFALDGDKVAFECAQLLAEMIFDPLTEGKSVHTAGLEFIGFARAKADTVRNILRCHKFTTLFNIKIQYLV